MRRRLLVVAQAAGWESQLDPVILAIPEYHWEHAQWDNHLENRVRTFCPHAIVAVASSIPSVGAEQLQRLRPYTASCSRVAILPVSVDESLWSEALRTTDDFLLSPVRASEFRCRLRRLIGGPGEDEMSGNDLSQILGTAELVGQSPVFKRVVEQILDLARANVVVLITGETGTGKELCARAIHHLGKRRNLPFIPVDCASLPDHLFENEMFGHVRGAYTDARRDQKGLIALAEGGTLLLDEIDALSASAQAKLLRFLQERTYRSLGAERFVRADVNVIAASNRELDSCVAAGTFRSDLFFRLNVFRLHLPPLRDRHNDIRMLALHFLQRLCADSEQPCKSISPAALRALELHTWPGNVRELHNLVQRAVVLARGEQILSCHLQIPTSLEPMTHGRKTFRDARASAIAEFERHFLIDLLRRHGGNITQAARDAGKDRRALGRLVKKYSLRSSLASGQL